MELPEPGILYLILLGVSVLFGITFGRKLGSIVALSLSLPVFLLVGGFFVTSISAQLPPAERNKFLGITIAILTAILLLGSGFGRQIFGSFLGSFLYDIFKSVFKISAGIKRRIFRMFRS
jgi:hypothetical protein